MRLFSSRSCAYLAAGVALRPDANNFAARADALARARRTPGWKVEVHQPKPSKALFAGPKKYADNFKWQGPKGRKFPDLYIPPPPKQ